MAENTVKITCSNKDCGKTFELIAPPKPGTYRARCPHCHATTVYTAQAPGPKAPGAASHQPQQQQQQQSPQQQAPAPQQQPKMTIQCGRCGQKFSFIKPAQPNRYDVVCPHCKSTNQFIIKGPAQQQTPGQQQAQASGQQQLSGQQQQTPDQQQTPGQQPARQNQIKEGLQPDGTYVVFHSCGQMVKVLHEKLSPGKNAGVCPRCKNPIRFETGLPASMPFTCPSCQKGKIDVAGRGDGVYSLECDNPGCEDTFSLIVQDGLVTNATPKTRPMFFMQGPLQPSNMMLETGGFFNRQRHELHVGTIWIGRADPREKSDFQLNDNTVSRRSLKIEVNPDNSGSYYYRMTVVKATNPVYHNGMELSVGSEVYLAYGDTINVGKTLIRVIKNEKK